MPEPTLFEQTLQRCLRAGKHSELLKSICAAGTVVMLSLSGDETRILLQLPVLFYFVDGHLLYGRPQLERTPATDKTNRY